MTGRWGADPLEGVDSLMVWGVQSGSDTGSLLVAQHEAWAGTPACNSSEANGFCRP